MSISFMPIAVFLLAVGIPATGITNHTQAGSFSDQDVIKSVENATTAGRGSNNNNNNMPDDSSKTDINTTNISNFPKSTVVINEIELNPSRSDDGQQWIELYNPSGNEVNINNLKLVGSFGSEISLPRNIVLKSHETYIFKLDNQALSHIETLALKDVTDKKTVDRTPTLIDRSDDNRTWQRIPDGANEWKFAEGTPGKLNDPDPAKGNSLFDISATSAAHCIGSAGCMEGVAIRIVNADTLYVNVNGTTYKVDLALTKIPAKGDQGFIEATSFSRNLCLGSNVLVDQDDSLLTSDDGSIIAVVYCSDTNLNSELLNNGYATLNRAQCVTSEFATESWAKDHGC
jgi:endonuclease YncB( thermonuclease family)